MANANTNMNANANCEFEYEIKAKHAKMSSSHCVSNGMMAVSRVEGREQGDEDEGDVLRSSGWNLAMLTD